METFDYHGKTLKHVIKHNDFCDGCFFDENNILCTAKDVPDCGNGIFVEAELKKQGEQKTIDKVKSKFKVGEWVVQENIGVYKVIEICESWYEVIDNEDKHYSIGFDKECMCHLWTIDECQGWCDVLTNGDCPCIFKSINEENAMFVYCGINAGGDFATKSKGKDNIWDDEPENYCPATKEQRDFLFAKMKEAGYEWDAGKKELKKIEQKQVIDYPDSLPKDNWELVHEFVEKFGRIPEDEDELNALVEYILRRQKSAWNEYDNIMVRDILGWLPAKSRPEYNQRRVDWLKSLKQRCTWKPSDEQMSELENYIGTIPPYEPMFQIFKSLYNDLKKIKGE